MLPPRQSFADRANSLRMGVQGGALNTPVNPDMPVGNPIDTIAQMLGLDLTNAISPDQQGQVVVEAVETLVNKLHELTGQEMPEDQEFVEGQDDGEDENEYDGEYDNEDGDGEEYEDEEEFDDEHEREEDDVEEEEEYDDSEDEPEEEFEQQPQRRRPHPARRGFSASLDTSPIPQKALKLVCTAREIQINQMIADGYITPHTAKQLKQDYCTPKALSLALSMDDESSDGFDKVCNTLVKNGKVITFGERSGEQTGLSTMDASDGKLYELSHDEISNPKKNPLLANATSRKK